jgi:hypothetical protein
LANRNNNFHYLIYGTKEKKNITRRCARTFDWKLFAARWNARHPQCRIPFHFCNRDGQRTGHQGNLNSIAAQMARMKNIQIFILFAIGLTLVGIGVICRIMEYSAVSFFLIVGMTFTAVAGLLLILKLFKKDKPGSFLDS